MGSHVDMAAITKGLKTKSDQIRALASAGIERKYIAKFMGIRYQHVRNVLEQDKQRAQLAPKDEQQGSEQRSAYVEIGAGGRIVIPAAFREAMGVKDGDRLLARLVDGEVRLISKPVALRQAREILKKYVPEGVSLVDELIADRRREAAMEDDDK